MAHFDAPRLRLDMRSSTEVLQAKAGDLGDDFLQYLYGMALLHLGEKLRGPVQRIEALPSNDPNIALAAKLVATVRKGF